jgi:hypothetical protein
MLRQDSIMRAKVPDMANNKEETRKERFKRVASRRTNNILRQIQILGNCSNKSSYSYSEEDIRKIFSAIEGELRNVKASFANSRKKTDFRL